MTPDQVLEHYNKNVSAVSRALGISRPAFYRWQDEGAIPFDRQCQIQIATNNKLIADKKHAIKKINVFPPKQHLKDEACRKQV